MNVGRIKSEVLSPSPVRNPNKPKPRTPDLLRPKGSGAFAAKNSKVKSGCFISSQFGPFPYLHI